MTKPRGWAGSGELFRRGLLFVDGGPFQFDLVGCDLNAAMVTISVRLLDTRRALTLPAGFEFRLTEDETTVYYAGETEVHRSTTMATLQITMTAEDFQFYCRREDGSGGYDNSAKLDELRADVAATIKQAEGVFDDD